MFCCDRSRNKKWTGDGKKHLNQNAKQSLTLACTKSQPHCNSEFQQTPPGQKALCPHAGQQALIVLNSGTWMNLASPEVSKSCLQYSSAHRHQFSMYEKCRGQRVRTRAAISISNPVRYRFVLELIELSSEHVQLSQTCISQSPPALLKAKMSLVTHKRRKEKARAFVIVGLWSASLWLFLEAVHSSADSVWIELKEISAEKKCSFIMRNVHPSAAANFSTPIYIPGTFFLAGSAFCLWLLQSKHR